VRSAAASPTIGHLHADLGGVGTTRCSHVAETSGCAAATVLCKNTARHEGAQHVSLGRMFSEGSSAADESFELSMSLMLAPTDKQGFQLEVCSARA